MNPRSCSEGERARHPAALSTGRPVVLASLLAMVLVGGCGDSSKEPLPPAEIKTVEAYGVTLDPAASPRDVVYVLLRSIADDYAAAKVKDPEAQRKAQLITYSLSAANTLEAAMVQTLNILNPKTKKTSLGDERDERIFKTVHYWGPVVGHYVPTFAEIDRQTLLRDSWATIDADGKQAHVLYPVSHDPTADPAQTETATIQVELARESAQAGDAKYWRVARVRFLGQLFLPPAQAVTVHMNGLVLDEAATPPQVASALLQSLAQFIQADHAKAKNVRASALYRTFCLANLDHLSSRMGGKKDSDVMVAAIKNWTAQVMPNHQAIQAECTPEKMQVVKQEQETAEVICPLGDTGASVWVQLARQSASNKSYWRVVNVKAASPTNAPGN